MPQQHPQIGSRTKTILDRIEIENCDREQYRFRSLMSGGTFHEMAEYLKRHFTDMNELKSSVVHDVCLRCEGVNSAHY